MSICKKKYFGAIEIVLGLAVLLGSAGAIKHIKQSNALNKTADLNKEQSEKIDKLIKDLQLSNESKDAITKSLQETETKLKEQAKTGFSVLYEQSVDIYEENKTPFTESHVDTAKGYVETWGYDSMAKIIKWQMATIKEQQKATAQLLLKQKELELKLASSQIEFEQELGKTKIETETHKMLASNLKIKVNDFVEAHSSLNGIIQWLCIGLGILAFVSISGYSILAGLKTRATQQLRDVKTAIKSFTEVNDEGNSTMNAIIKAHKIDLDK